MGISRVFGRVLAYGCAAALASLSLGDAAFAQGKLHAILLGDTLDANIGSGAKVNIDAFSRVVTNIASAIGATANVKKIVDKDFNCENLNAAVKAISTTRDDMVVFYYSGHGYRVDGQASRFPRLWCHGAPPTNPVLEDIALGFRSVPSNTLPRMVWAVADACNATDQDAAGLVAGLDPTMQAAYEKLFKKTAGTMIMSGADMHQFSWYFPSGGQFSISLLSALAAETKKGADAAWESLTPRAMKAFETQYNGKTYIQQPIYASTLAPVVQP